MFQPAEEVGGGAKAMVKDGALMNPRPDISLGLHLSNGKPVGTLSVADGPIMAGGSVLNIVVQGKGGHGAKPQETHDPVLCAAQIVTALQSIVSRNTDPLDSAVLSITRIHGGTANNIIPDAVELGGTVRTYTHEIRSAIGQRIREICSGIATAMGCTVDVQIDDIIEPVTNDPEVSERVRNAMRRQGYGDENFLYERTTASEDVGEFMVDIPGMYFFVGSADPAQGEGYPHHHPLFDIDEDCLPIGVEVMAAALADYVVSES